MRVLTLLVGFANAALPPLPHPFAFRAKHRVEVV